MRTGLDMHLCRIMATASVLALGCVPGQPQGGSPAASAVAPTAAPAVAPSGLAPPATAEVPSVPTGSGSPGVVAPPARVVKVATVPGQLVLSNDPDTFYDFLPSISTDGRLVAVLVKLFDHVDVSHIDQDLIVTSTSSGRTLKRFKLFRLESRDRDLTESQRQARAGEANAWLSKHKWRALHKCEGEYDSQERVCSSADAPACSVEYRGPKYKEPYFVSPPRLTVRKAGRRIVDVIGEDWPYRAKEKYCWLENMAFSRSIWLDAAADVVVVQLDFIGGHDGCLPPMPELRVVRLPRGACR